MKQSLLTAINTLKGKWFIVGAFACLGAWSSYAQTTLSGKITDENNEGMPSVNVIIEGTQEGVTTDLEGNFSFTTKQTGQRVLRASFIGYQTYKMAVTLNGTAQTLNISMKPDPMSLDMVVVTGTVNNKSKIESSVSITTLDPKTIEQSAPRTTAEIFRTIPGIKAEASAGDGNTNISVRGVPISSGGSRYLQLQEDGLPVLLYGDIAFSTQDQYIRIDPTIERVEAIRGGSAAITTSNGPAGIINFISKTGTEAGGTIGTSFGLNYQSNRTDFNVGAPLGNGLFLNVGGFYRLGEGPRQANHLVNNGGQIKANITKKFDNGFARVYFKVLNDRTAAYMPMPVSVSGTNSNPVWESVNGLNAASNGLHSPLFLQNFGLGADGNFRNRNINDGMHTVSNAVGTTFDFDLGDGWRFVSNSRYTYNRGSFTAPFTAEVGNTQSLVEGILTANNDTAVGGGLLPYTINKVSNGEVIANTENGLAQRIHLFDVELENFNNFMSDNRLSKTFGKLDLSLGTFYAHQNIEMAWLWNSFLMEVKQDGDLLNINTANGDVTQNGLLNYGVPLWGNCCTGKYNNSYDVLAPYINLAIAVTDKLNIDGGVRYDRVHVRGMVTPSQQLLNFDVNGNGTIEAPERSVSRVDNTRATLVNYNYAYTSYSLGANYLINENSAVFSRVSQGYVGNAERATWHQAGPYLENGAPKNSLFQAEAGYKRKFNNGGLFVTAFYANTQEEAGVEVTTQNVLSNDYESYGLELESFFRIKGFDVRGAITYVRAEIVGNNDNINIGNTPRRQPGLSYNILPSYNFKKGHIIGVSVIGQTQSYAQDNNELVMPGYAIVNAFASYRITKKLSINLNANNLLNALGFTEAEEGSIVENQTNFIRARSIAGRSIMGGVVLNF